MTPTCTGQRPPAPAFALASRSRSLLCRSRLGLLALVGTAMAVSGGGLAGTAAPELPAGAWPDAHGGAKGWHYSALDEIDARNVSRLRPVWSHSPDLQTEGLESMPVAADGLIAYCSGSDQVWVLDGATGRQKWHARVGPGSEPGHAPPCRGLALDNGTLYFAGAGGRVAAWNAASGELRWEVLALPPERGHGVLTGPPMVIGGRLVLGSEADSPAARAVLLGLDTQTGREVWHADLVGGNGSASGAWDGRGSWGADAAAAGGSAWMPGIYDPLSRRLFWGTGSPLPLFDAAGADYKTHGPRPGDNLYTGGVLALDPETGAWLAWHQEIPHEVWVRDAAASELMVIDRGGRRFLVHPNRSGLVFVYGTDLKPIRVWQAIRNFNLARSVDPQTGAFRRRHDLNAGDRRGVCPLVEGGLPGLPGAFSPQTGLWYKVGVEWCMDIDLDHGPERAAPGGQLDAAGTRTGGALLGGRVTPVPPADGRIRAHLDARDPLTGAKVWTLEFPEPPLASLLVTAGRLLFVADGRGVLQALDAGSGRRVWSYDGHEGQAGGLLSYQAGGHQYIAVVSGWDARLHPMFGRVFGPPYSVERTPHATLRAFRLP